MEQRAPAAAAPAPGAPLSTRMRPRSLEEFAGQEHAVGPGAVLRRALESDTLPSIILWGPPGSGKTTLAGIVAAMTGSAFEAVSAVSSGVADLRRIVDRAAERRRAGRRTVLFIDEIHRFNKAQQDAILPHVESGLVAPPRRDHGEPRVRGERRAALPGAGGPARGARCGGDPLARGARPRRHRARARWDGGEIDEAALDELVGAERRRRPRRPRRAGDRRHRDP